MNSVAPLAPARAPGAAPAGPAPAARRPPAAAEALHRRARPVGRQLEQRRRAGEPLAASRRAAPPAPRPAASSRCQTAKSAYWIGSSGSGDGRPAADRRRRAPPARGPARPSTSRRETMWCRVSRTARAPRRQAQQGGAQQRPAREVERAAAPPPASRRDLAPAARSAGRAREVDQRQRRAASSGAITCTGRPPRTAKVVRSASCRRDDLAEGCRAERRQRRAARRGAAPTGML